MNDEGQFCGVVRRTAVTDGAVIVTPEGEEFFAAWAIDKLLGRLRS